MIESMRATVRLSALVALGMLALACGAPPAGQAAGSGGSTNTATKQQDVEQPGAADAAIRDFSVNSFSGKEFVLSAQRGSPVVLNFFESW